MVSWHDNILQENVIGLLLLLFSRQKKAEDASLHKRPQMSLFSLQNEKIPPIMPYSGSHLAVPKEIQESF